MTPIHRLNTRDQFGAWLNENGFSGIGVEIGTFQGHYAAVLGKQWKGTLITIDPYDWPNQPSYVDGCRKDWTKEEAAELDPEKVMMEAAQLLAPLANVSMMRLQSVVAARCFPLQSLDFVFIDGDHSAEAVSADIAAWTPNIKPGGILAGHDFYTRDDELQKNGTLGVVWDLSERLHVRPHVTQCTSWWFQL